MKKATILSVDDDPGLQTVLKQYLEGEGYAVLTAGNGAEAQQTLSAMPNLDIILLDLVLPDTDGLSLISIIRNKSQIPIVVVSGKRDTTEKIVCLEMGADDYLTKPFEMRELSARIKAALRRLPARAANQSSTDTAPHNDNMVAEFSDFKLDRGQFQLFDGNGNSLDITTGEFTLLDALISSPNRALSREQLFEITRDGDFDSYDRAIDIQIGRIRKKLGSKGLDIIRTVRGVGYMFCPTDKN